MRLLRVLSFPFLIIIAFLISYNFTYAEQGYIGEDEIVIDGEAYKRTITEFQQIKPSQGVSYDYYYDSENPYLYYDKDSEHYQQSYPNLDGQTITPTVVCDNPSGTNCYSMGVLGTAVGEPVYGEYFGESDLWQKVNINGEIYYMPYESFLSEDSPLIQSIGIGTGMASRVSTPFYAKGSSYTFKTDLPGSYIAQLLKNNNRNQYFALDYGYNIKTDGTANLHWNTKPRIKNGVDIMKEIWGVENHQVIGPYDLEIKKITGEPYRPKFSNKFNEHIPLNIPKSVRSVARVGFVAGAAIDAYGIYTAEDKTKEISRVAGGWAGSAIGAKAGATVGATIGAFGGPLGAVIGGTVGAMVGGIGGYIAGSVTGEVVHDNMGKVYDNVSETTNRTYDEVNNVAEK